ncbi:MAG: D-glycero-beta-D-manno-heptose 1-phosphate adenylyltransferase [Candidatus Binatia bacterium]
MTRPAARKVLARGGLARRLAAHRRAGERIVFTNGVFDLLHPGHVRYLGTAKRLGDVLVVGVNSDRSARALGKGPERPLVPARDRAEVLAALAAVDYVTIFDADTPYALIDRLQPDVLVKGGDWSVDRIVGADLVRARGGRVRAIPLAPGYSTTRLVERMLRARPDAPSALPARNRRATTRRSVRRRRK